MSGDCIRFRDALERRLAGARSGDLRDLAWHAHLLDCGGCRALLEAEEALEALLASLPEPRLPAELTRRVLAALRAARASGDPLERLLVLGGEVEVPEGLARDVLARVARRVASPVLREDRLDALPARAGAVEVPSGLSARILAGLSRARRPALRLARAGWALAAAVLLALATWILWPGRDGPRREDPAPVAREVQTPDPELLAALDVLEQWDLLMRDDLELMLSTLGLADEALLEYAGEAPAEEPAPPKEKG